MKNLISSLKVPHSLRVKIGRDLNRGLTQKEIGSKYGVSLNTVKRIKDKIMMRERQVRSSTLSAVRAGVFIYIVGVLYLSAVRASVFIYIVGVCIRLQ